MARTIGTPPLFKGDEKELLFIPIFKWLFIGFFIIHNSRLMFLRAKTLGANTIHNSQFAIEVFLEKLL
jgi:hypothetical protein